MVFSVNQLLTICWSITDLTPGGAGGGGYLSHTCISFTGMCRLNGFRVWCRFGRKMGIDFVHFGLELGMVFKGTVEVYKHIIVLIPNG